MPPLLVAIIVAAIVGAIGAGVNGALLGRVVALDCRRRDRRGTDGVVLVRHPDLGGVAAATAAIAATVITLGVSVLGLFTPLMDESDSGVAWAFSWAIKLIISPVFTIIGLFVVAGLAISRKRVDFRRGALFVEVGAGTGGLTLGAIVYTQSGNFDSNGNVRDDVARHEAYHTRTDARLENGVFT